MLATHTEAALHTDYDTGYSDGLRNRADLYLAAVSDEYSRGFAAGQDDRISRLAWQQLGRTSRRRTAETVR